MKNKALAFSLVSSFISAAAFAGGPYYLTSDGAAKDNGSAFEDAQYWQDAGGATYAGATVFDPEADYVVEAGRAVFTRTGWQNLSPLVFGGRQITFGSLAKGKVGHLSMYYSGRDFKVDMKKMVLEAGSIRNNYSVENANNTLDGDIEVKSPASAPFSIWGWNNGYTLALTGDVSSSDDTVGLLFGGNHGNKLTVKPTGSWANYTGELRLRKSSASPLAADDTTLVACSNMSFPGKLALGEKTTLALAQADDDFVVKTLDLAAGSKLTFKVGGRATAAKVEVTDAVTVASPVTIDLDVSALAGNLNGLSATLLILPDGTEIDGTEFVLSESAAALGITLDYNVENKTLIASTPLVVGTYYLTADGNNKDGVAFDDAQYWQDAVGATYDGGTVFDPDGDYVVAAGRQLNTRYGWQNLQPVVFGGRTLTFGNLAKNESGFLTLRHNGFEHVADMGHMVLEAGSIRNTNDPNSSNTLDGEIEVKSPATAPFSFWAWNNGFTLVLTGDVSSPDDTVGLVFGGNNGNKLTVKPTGSWANYLGELRLKKSKAAPLASDDTTLVACSNMSFPGTLALEEATTLALNSSDDDLVVDTLDLAAGSKLKLAVDVSGLSAKVEATTSVTAAYPVTIDLVLSSGTLSDSGLYATLMILPEEAEIDGTEFVLSESAAALGITLAYDDETKTLIAKAPATVTQTVSDGGSHQTTRASSLLNADHWSDTRPVHDNANYFVQPINNVACYLQTPVGGDFAFEGDSLTFKGWCFFYCSLDSFDCKKLSVLNSSRIYMCNNSGSVATTTFKGGIVDFPSGTVRICAWGSTWDRPVTFESELTGAAEVVLGSVESTSSTAGSTYFKALNDDFLGKITVSLQNATGGETPSATKCQTLLVNDGRNVGGALAAMDYEALKLTQWARLAVAPEATAVTFEDGVNRGIAVSGVAQIQALEGQSLAIRRPLTVDGTLNKEGAGLLELASDVRLGAGANALAVNAGAVLVSSAGAVNGLALAVADGAALRIDPSNAALVTYGIRNEKAATPLADAGADGKVRVELVADDAAALVNKVIPLLTVKADQAAAVQALLSVTLAGSDTPIRFKTVTENVTIDDVACTIIKADFTRKPMALLVR